MPTASTCTTACTPVYFYMAYRISVLVHKAAYLAHSIVVCVPCAGYVQGFSGGIITTNAERRGG